MNWYTTTFPFFSKHQKAPETLLGQWLYMSQCYSTPFMRLQKGVIARWNSFMIQQSYFFDIQYSLLQNNIFKLEIKLYLLSTGIIDHDELFFRNLLSEQVCVFFLLIKFSIVLQIRICGQVILIFNDKLTNSTIELQNYLAISEHNRLVVFLVCYSLVSNYRVISFFTRVFFLVSRYFVLPNIKSFCPVEAVKSLTNGCTDEQW